jgi:hypothetical protein
LQFLQWPEQADDDAHDWACPHCKAPNIATARGHLVRVLPWYDPAND